MRLTQVRRADLNLLVVFLVLAEARSVSRAAERLGRSQPAVSRGLGRLRDMFHDELLVRTPRGYEPTPRGQRVLAELESMLPRLDQFSWAVEGLPLTPCALAEPGGQAVVIDQAPPSVLERAVRAFVYETGGWAALALRPTPVEAAAGAAITGSVSRALGLGRAHAGLCEHPEPVAVAASLDGTVLADGRVIEVSRYGRTGVFGRGSVAVID